MTLLHIVTIIDSEGTPSVTVCYNMNELEQVLYREEGRMFRVKRAVEMPVDYAMIQSKERLREAMQKAKGANFDWSQDDEMYLELTWIELREARG